MPIDKKPHVTDITVKRTDEDGQEISLPLWEFYIQKGIYKEEPYWTLEDVTADNFANFTRFVGMDKVLRQLTLWKNQLGVQILHSCAKKGPADAEGFEPIESVNMDDVVSSWEDMRIAGDNLDDMKTRREELMESIGKIYQDAIDTGDIEKITKAKEYVTQNVHPEIKKLDADIKARSEEFAARSAKRKDRKKDAAKPATQQAVAA